MKEERRSWNEAFASDSGNEDRNQIQNKNKIDFLSIDKLVFLNLSDEFPFSELSIGALDGATK